MNEPISQKVKLLTVEEFFAIYSDKEERYELIDGIAFMMAAPSTVHQDLSMFLSIEIGNFLKGKKCKVFAAPYDIFLNESPKDKDGKLIKKKRVKGTVVQPDLIVVCDKEKIQPDGCHGAPDFVIEIASISTKDRDKSIKFHKYFSSGVKEYWIIDPEEQIGAVYIFNLEGKKAEVYPFTFDDKVKSHVLEGLEIDFAEFNFE